LCFRAIPASSGVAGRQGISPKRRTECCACFIEEALRAMPPAEVFEQKEEGGWVFCAKYSVNHCGDYNQPFPSIAIHEIGTRQMKLSKETAHGDS